MTGGAINTRNTATVPSGGKPPGGMAGPIAAAALLASTVLIAPWEGKRNDPYLDIVKVRTVCYGETRVAMRRYSDAECAAMLQKAVAVDFAPKVFACTPAVADHLEVAAAAISLAYNIGTAKYCGSTAARLFNAGDWRGGCVAIGRFAKAGGRVVPGLVNRRRKETALCLKGAA